MKYNKFKKNISKEKLKNNNFNRKRRKIIKNSYEIICLNEEIEIIKKD